MNANTKTAKLLNARHVSEHSGVFPGSIVCLKGCPMSMVTLGEDNIYVYSVDVTSGVIYSVLKKKENLSSLVVVSPGNGVVNFSEVELTYETNKDKEGVTLIEEKSTGSEFVVLAQHALGYFLYDWVTNTVYMKNRWDIEHSFNEQYQPDRMPSGMDEAFFKGIPVKGKEFGASNLGAKIKPSLWLAEQQDLLFADNETCYLTAKFKRDGEDVVVCKNDFALVVYENDKVGLAIYNDDVMDRSYALMDPSVIVTSGFLCIVTDFELFFQVRGFGDQQALEWLADFIYRDTHRRVSACFYNRHMNQIDPGVFRSCNFKYHVSGDAPVFGFVSDKFNFLTSSGLVARSNLPTTDSYVSVSNPYYAITATTGFKVNKDGTRESK